MVCSPNLTLSKETMICFRKKSKRQEDGHDNENNFIKTLFYKLNLKKKKTYQVG